MGNDLAFFDMPQPDIRYATPLTSGYVQWTRFLIFVIALISLLTLSGWIFDVDSLKGPFAAITAMNPVSALCFLLICCSVFRFTVSHQERRSMSWVMSGFVLPGILILVGSIVFVQNILFIDHGLDSLIFHDKLQAQAGKSISCGMGPLTSFSFVLSGIVIMLSTHGRAFSRKSANVLSVAILLAAVFSLTGYIYHVREFYDHQPYRPMAIQTSISFIILSLILLHLNPQAGFMTIVSDARLGGFIARMMIPAAIMAPILVGYIRLRLQWAFPVSVELGVNFLICGIVILFIMLILYVAREINLKDRLREEAEGKLAAINEVLEQKVAERTAELYSSERRSKALIENSFDVVALYDHDMRLTYLSPSFQRLTGFTVQQRMLLTGLAFGHPEDLDASLALIRQVLETPNFPFPFQNRLLHKDGHYIWVEGVLTNLLSDNEVRAVVSNYREITERKAAEETLRASEVKFRSLIENSFDSFALSNERNEITYLSPSAERITGIRLQDGQVTDGFLLAHPDDLEVIKALFEQSLSHPGVPVPFQCRAHHALGHYIWVEGVLTNLLSDKNIGAVVANLRDVTDRKRHEEALEETNKEIQDILESSIDCFFSCDRNWIIRYWNKAAEEFTRIKREEIAGKSLWAIFPLPAKSIAYQSLHRTMDEGVPISFEDSYGNTWFGATAYPSKGGLSAFFRDITERKRLEMVNLLEKEVLEFYTMRKSAPLEETITLLLNGVQRIHSEMLCSVLRLENGRLYNWASPHLPAAYTMAIHGAAIGPAEGSCGTAAFRKQNVIVTDIANDPLWVKYRELAAAHNLLACWSHVILNDDHEVLGTFAIYYKTIRSPKPAELWTIERAHIILRNIIENQLAEERILKLNTELEDRVSRRTQQLEEANKELESFSYSVSHDLRAPLRSINGYGHILMEDYSRLIGEEGKRVLNTVISNAQRMGVLIDDLLDFSRIGKARLKSHPVDMNLMVKEVVQELRFQFSGDHIQWQIADLKSARCDLSLIKQVWTNLISNAIKYSARRQCPMITVGMKEEGKLITYFIKDNGAGFDMRYYHKLFGVFQRLHNVEDFPGTGVGLAIVQRIVKRHGGRVWAESELDRGTVFYFTLPVA